VSGKRLPLSYPDPTQIQRALQRRGAEEAGYGDFRASQLYCPKCKQANPVRERLLLVLPTGDLTEYVCAVCGTSVGKKQA
jgi:uncharacterized protein YbaR (Trm112 family)